MVEDDKAGIDGLIAALACDDGAGMAAQPGFAFKKHHGVVG